MKPQTIQRTADIEIETCRHFVCRSRIAHFQYVYCTFKKACNVLPTKVFNDDQFSALQMFIITGNLQCESANEINNMSNSSDVCQRSSKMFLISFDSPIHHFSQHCCDGPNMVDSPSSASEICRECDHVK